MQEGDVILTPIPQADGRVKNRPAIFLREMPLYGDLLVCGISTQLHHYVSGFDEIITPADIDFGTSGLLSASLIWRPSVDTLPRRLVPPPRKKLIALIPAKRRARRRVHEER
jgi:mRNA interferase MazF